MAYLYRHIRLDTNMPFYVGIGKRRDRAFDTCKRSKYWSSIVSKTDYRVDILFDDLNYKEAKEKEREFISLYGRSDLEKGTLCNMTDGGEGTVGRIISDEEKCLRSVSAKKALSNIVTRKKMSDSGKKKTFSENHKKNISKSKSYSVIDKETGMEFPSLREACKYFNEGYRKHRGRQEQGLKNIRFIRKNKDKNGLH